MTHGRPSLSTAHLGAGGANHRNTAPIRQCTIALIARAGPGIWQQLIETEAASPKPPDHWNRVGAEGAQADNPANDILSSAHI